MSETLADEHKALLQFLYTAPVGLAQLRRNGDIVLTNPLCAQWLLPLTPDGTLANLFQTLQGVAPELEGLVAAFGSATGTVCEGLQLALPDRLGRRRWGRVLSLTLISLDGMRLMALLQDMTDAVRRERELRLNQMWMNTVVVGLADYALIELDDRGCVSSWNLGVHRTLGFERRNCVGRSLAQFYPRGTMPAERVLERLQEADSSGWSLDEGWRLRADGTRFWGSCLIAPLYTRDANDEAEVPADERRYSLIVRDISDRREASEALRRAMTCDELTGLENRRSFFEALELELVRWRRLPRPLSLLMVDADHFKQINDQHGHAAGDAVLRHLAACLSATCRGMDVVARLGGEEFAVLLPGTTPEDANTVALRLCANLRQRAAQVEGAAITCTVSVGVAAMDADVSDAHALLHRADLAMYAAKAAGRNRVECWRPALSKLVQAAPSSHAQEQT
jgi:diguanylate cyclase (GGDEF)-like protein/PAS domain S-box-containing protein